MKFLLLPFLILLFRLPALGQDTQNEEPVVLLKGVIRDAATGEAIPLATISLAANGITTISNDNGLFIFKVPTAHRHDSMYISHIGYQSLALPLDEWLVSPAAGAGADGDGARRITLQSIALQLPAVTIRPPDALALIDSAIARIPDNYPSRPFVLTGFYRLDGVYKKRLVDLSEALFTIYSPDNQRRNMQFRLIRGRTDRDPTAFDGKDLSVGPTPDNLMDRDMISRIHQTQILGDAGRDDHNFSYGGLIDYEGHAAYEIRFDQRDDVRRSLYKGRIIIDTANLAFLCFDYGLSPKGLPWRSRGPGPRHAVSTGNTLVIRYRRYGTKYYLDQVHTVVHLHLYDDGNPPVRHDTLVTRLNYLVTRIDTGLVAFSRVGKKLDDRVMIAQQAPVNKGKKEDDYWSDYNSIAADYNVDSALTAIRKSGKK